MVKSKVSNDGARKLITEIFKSTQELFEWASELMERKKGKSILINFET